MRDFISLMLVCILGLLIIAIWLFPLILCAVTGNWWLMFIYFAWWIPASILTRLLSEFMELVQ